MIPAASGDNNKNDDSTNDAEQSDDDSEIVVPRLTPEYFHVLDKPLRDLVYEPEADSFLFLEALDKDIRVLRKVFRKKKRESVRCLEVGCGSGIVITHLGQLVSAGHIRTSGGAMADEEDDDAAEEVSGVVQFTAVDINPHALEAAKGTWSSTPETRDSVFPLTTTRSDLFSAMAAEPPPTSLHECGGGGDTPILSPQGTSTSRTSLKYDVILFNPPYVPTSQEELAKAVAGEDIVTAAWCGGVKGREVVDRFLKDLPHFLSTDGVCYVVVIKENDVDEMVDYVRLCFQQWRLQRQQSDAATTTGGLGGSCQEQEEVECEIVASRYTGEHLSIMRIRRR